MRDWAVAILLGVIVVGTVFATSILMTLFSVLLVPFLIFAAVVLGIWFLLQILKEERKAQNRKGPGP